MDVLTTEEKIMRAAVEEFAEHGFDGARIDRIAGRGKKNKAMIYYHYKGKQTLYEGVLTMIVTGIYEKVQSLVPEGVSPEEKLETVIRGYAAYLSSIDRRYIRIMLREVGSGGKYFKKITVPKLIAPAFALITGILEQGMREKQFSDMESVFVVIQSISMIVFYNMMRLTMDGSDLYPVLFGEGKEEQYIDTVVSVLKNGIMRDRGE